MALVSFEANVFTFDVEYIFLKIRRTFRSQWMCHQGRECPAEWRKLRQKYGGAHVFGTCFSLSLSRVRSTWLLRWSRVHRKEIILNCRIKVAVERVACLFYARWLASRDLSLKSRQHLNDIDLLFVLGRINLRKCACRLIHRRCPWLPYCVPVRVRGTKTSV